GSRDHAGGTFAIADGLYPVARRPDQKAPAMVEAGDRAIEKIVHSASPFDVSVLAWGKAPQWLVTRVIAARARRTAPA
ncbi:hypothetical protein ACE4Z5_27340, partial [Salmonella enterica]|uniref:hypothetical protein n=1 Tax=Salmonella enterica TaxID=28901 RepID=UPI003D2C3BA8